MPKVWLPGEAQSPSACRPAGRVRARVFRGCSSSDSGKVDLGINVEELWVKERWTSGRVHRAPSYRALLSLGEQQFQTHPPNPLEPTDPEAGPSHLADKFLESFPGFNVLSMTTASFPHPPLGQSGLSRPIFTTSACLTAPLGMMPHARQPALMPSARGGVPGPQHLGPRGAQLEGQCWPVLSTWGNTSTVRTDVVGFWAGNGLSHSTPRSDQQFVPPLCKEISSRGTNRFEYR